MSHTVTVSFGGLTGSATRGSLEEACRLAEAAWSRAKYSDELGPKIYDKRKYPQVEVEVRSARWKAWASGAWGSILRGGCGVQASGARLRAVDSGHIFNLAWRIAKKGERF